MTKFVCSHDTVVLTCSKFLTTSDYAPRLRQRLATEHTLIADASARGWDHEVERHQRTADRLTSILADLGEEPGACTHASLIAARH